MNPAQTLVFVPSGQEPTAADLDQLKAMNDRIQSLGGDPYTASIEPQAVDNTTPPDPGTNKNFRAQVFSDGNGGLILDVATMSAVTKMEIWSPADSTYYTLAAVAPNSSFVGWAYMFEAKVGSGWEKVPSIHVRVTDQQGQATEVDVPLS